MLRKISIATIFLFCFSIVTAYSQLWRNVKSGFDSVVQVLYTDTINNVLYAGGLFKTTGLDSVNPPARWDGNVWSSLGTGVYDSSFIEVNAICTYNNELYIGGHFKYAGDSIVNNIAKWDGAKWVALGIGIQPGGAVMALTVYDNELYVGGLFNKAGNNSLSSCIAKWNGTNWSEVGSGVDGVIYSMSVFKEELYVGGDFHSVGGIGSFGIGRWNGTTWAGVGHGIVDSDFRVNILKKYQGELYIGGVFKEFSSSGIVTAFGIAKWDGVQYYNVGAGMIYEVVDMAVLNNNLYIIGGFDLVGGVPANNIARYDGNEWCGLGNADISNLYNPFRKIAVYHDSLFIGGDFLAIDGITMNHITMWTGGDYTDSCASVQSSNQLDLGNEHILIYPNPSNGTIFIQLPAQHPGPATITIHDITGKAVVTKETNQNSGTILLDSGMLRNGLYIIRVERESGSWSGKIVIEK